THTTCVNGASSPAGCQQPCHAAQPLSCADAGTAEITSAAAAPSHTRVFVITASLPTERQADACLETAQIDALPLTARTTAEIALGRCAAERVASLDVERHPR